MQRKSTAPTEAQSTAIEKCARARALMQEAQQLIEEVLDDPEYDCEAEGWPRGVCADNVDLSWCIEMLRPETDPEPGDDDYMPPAEHPAQPARPD